MVVCPFVPFLLAIAFSGLLRLTISDYPFGIFKLSLLLYRHQKPDIKNGDTNNNWTQPANLGLIRYPPSV